jgi:hypothetical protein
MTYLYSMRCPAGMSTCGRERLRGGVCAESARLCAAQSSASRASLSQPRHAPTAPYLAGPDVALVPGHGHLGDGEEGPAKGDLGAAYAQHLPRVHAVVHAQLDAHELRRLLLVPRLRVVQVRCAPVRRGVLAAVRAVGHCCTPTAVAAADGRCALLQRRCCCCCIVAARLQHEQAPRGSAAERPEAHDGLAGRAAATGARGRCRSAQW